jgi:hypothetical protein
VSNSGSARNARYAYLTPLKTLLFSLGLIPFLCATMAIPACPASAAAESARWTKVSIPTEGEAGNWALAAGSDIELLTAGVDGTLYAYVKGLANTLFKSTDGGHSWEPIGGVRDAIVDIAISPQDPATVYFATSALVYRSVDGGRTFQMLPPNPGGAGADSKEITSIDAVRLEGNLVVAGTKDTDSAEFGGVYILYEGDIVPNWTDSSPGGCDVAAIAFSPHYSDNPQLIAVATDEIDTYVNIKTGDAGWNEDTGYALIDAVASSAQITFPGSYNPYEPVVYVGIDTGAGEGDVYRINGATGPETSIATDLNTGAGDGLSDIDIAGLAAYDAGGSIILLAGTADSAMTYVSADSGTTWTRSREAPAGVSGTGVLIAPDFDVTGMMYAATGGAGSGFSLSRDRGASWDQISLIDTAIESIIDVAPSPRYSQDGTIFMLTFGSGPGSAGLWRSLDGGLNWERTLADSPGDVESLSRVALPPEYGDGCQTVFAAGTSSGRATTWESTDGGQTYQRHFFRPPGVGLSNIDAWAIADKTTLFIAGYDDARGMVYKSVNRGISFAAGVPAGSQPLHSISVAPDFAQSGAALAGNSAGRVYFMDNTSNSFELLPADGTPPPFSGAVTVAFDPSYSNNRTVYAAGNDPGNGVYRFIIGESDAWESIDDSLPAGALVNKISVAADGTFYGVNAAANGGMERSLNPASAGPAFETIRSGLSIGATLYGLWQADSYIWSVDTTNHRLLIYNDTLTAPPATTSPEDGASAAGSLVAHTVRGVTLDWEPVAGASGYEWECNYNDDFTAVSGVFGDSTSGTSERLPALEPATTYHWRVRVSSPALSPWSERRSFTTIMDTEAITLRPESPTPGDTGVSIEPVFQWTAVIGAEAYELLIATNAVMNEPVITRNGGYAIAENVWRCDVSLDYATTYYWKVRAVNSSTSSAWSTTGIFTTEEAPVETPPPTLDHEAPLIQPLSDNPAQGQVAELPAPTPSLDIAATEDPKEAPDVFSGVPDWVVYLIGGLMGTVILALIVVLVTVIKIKRIM